MQCPHSMAVLDAYLAQHDFKPKLELALNTVFTTDELPADPFAALGSELLSAGGASTYDEVMAMLSEIDAAIGAIDSEDGDDEDDDDEERLPHQDRAISVRDWTAVGGRSAKGRDRAFSV